MKRIASIQDLSCIGKCSLGIALPIFSAMGIECAALPTAILSTHTAFDGFAVKDLTDQISPFAAHWEQLGLSFDALYTGYLASGKQIAVVRELFDRFGTADNLIFVDPAMADHGKLYKGFDREFPIQMRELCARADIITPNVTEACLLTGSTYRETHDEAYIHTLLQRLLDIGAHTVMITGVRYQPDTMSVVTMDASGKESNHYCHFIPAQFHGTGDLFASTCLGALLRGFPVSSAIALAADYVAKTILVTTQNPDARWYGVDFESTIPYLLEQIHAYREDVL